MTKRKEPKHIDRYVEVAYHDGRTGRLAIWRQGNTVWIENHLVDGYSLENEMSIVFEATIVRTIPWAEINGELNEPKPHDL